MSQNITTEEFEMDFDRYIENIHSDLAYWKLVDDAGAPLPDQIFRYSNRIFRTSYRIMVLKGKRGRLASDEVSPTERQAELLSEYDNLLDLLEPLLEWLQVMKEDLQDLWVARIRGDEETAREIAEAMESEPGFF
ncbi:hypothetical protein DSL72_006264 [Monilinia vaccinii-corymbosi]|uniref:Uncharacterized protein n=1 Tax=Monilinia vaccinii-corymbosi TaxID=61207 RepID=A0A8A3PM04_9HELO|nr:hypothetical protein DSL72_006264 [Monilinia vaccinii-corymbosi]